MTYKYFVVYRVCVSIRILEKFHNLLVYLYRYTKISKVYIFQPDWLNLIQLNES